MCEVFYTMKTITLLSTIFFCALSPFSLLATTEDVSTYLSRHTGNVYIDEAWNGDTLTVSLMLDTKTDIVNAVEAHLEYDTHELMYSGEKKQDESIIILPTDTSGTGIIKRYLSLDGITGKKIITSITFVKAKNDKKEDKPTVTLATDSLLLLDDGRGTDIFQGEE